MLKIYREPGTNVSFEYQLQRAGINDNDIKIIHTLTRDIDVICAATSRELLPYIQRFGNKFRYLLWCDEPLWLGLERLDPIKFSDEVKLQYGVDIFVISHASGGLRWHWKVFLGSDYMPSSIDISKDRIFKKAVFLAQYRAGASFRFSMYNNSSLCIDREKLALRAWVQDMCDISGVGWPVSIISFPNNRGGNWVESKLHILTSYRYNICSENTLCPGYTTEKIWHSIRAGCLPIYHFCSYYSDPMLRQAMAELRSICIDCSNAMPWEIIDQMKSMSDVTYNKKINQARDVLESILPAGSSKHNQGEDAVNEIKTMLGN